MINVKIHIEDETGKKADLEISEADNLSKLVIIQNVFNLFGISSDIMEIAKTYSKIGEAYSEFFNEVESIEPIKIENNIKNTDEIKQQLLDGFENNMEEIKHTYKSNDEHLEYTRTGIKTKEDGTKLYRLRYECTLCHNKGTHYVFETSRTTWCHSCKHEMRVYSASPEGFPSVDFHVNFFRAGEYKDWNLEWKIGS